MKIYFLFSFIFHCSLIFFINKKHYKHFLLANNNYENIEKSNVYEVEIYTPKPVIVKTLYKLNNTKQDENQLLIIAKKNEQEEKKQQQKKLLQEKEKRLNKQKQQKKIEEQLLEKKKQEKIKQEQEAKIAKQKMINAAANCIHSKVMELWFPPTNLINSKVNVTVLIKIDNEGKIKHYIFKNQGSTSEYYQVEESVERVLKNEDLVFEIHNNIINEIEITFCPKDIA